MDKKVIILYHYIPHYRGPVFKCIEKHLDVVFAAGDNNQNGVNILPHSALSSRSITLKNRWLFEKFLWQSGGVKLSLLDDYDCIILLADPHFISSWFVILIAKLRRKKVLLWTHGKAFDNTIKDRIKRFLYRHSDSVLLYGNRAKEQLVKHGIEKHKLRVIYNSLDYEEQRKYRECHLVESSLKPLKEKLFQHPQLKTVCFVGRLIASKKIELAIKLIADLAADNIKVNFLIVGQGPLYHSLRQLTVELDIQNYVTFYGECYEEQTLASLFMLSDVCISPGEVGLTALHSLVYGTPVITHDNFDLQGPEVEAVIDEKTGWLFDINSIASLKSAFYRFYRCNSVEIRTNCIDVIEKHYTPLIQTTLIEQSLRDLYA